MLRPFFQSARCVVRAATPVARPIAARVQPQRFTPALIAIRGYAASSGMSKPEVEGRILDLLKGFDKVGVSMFCDGFTQEKLTTGTRSRTPRKYDKGNRSEWDMDATTNADPALTIVTLLE